MDTLKEGTIFVVENRDKNKHSNQIYGILTGKYEAALLTIFSRASELKSCEPIPKRALPLTDPQKVYELKQLFISAGKFLNFKVWVDV